MEIWTEKYRPHNFDELKGQEGIVARIEAMVKTKNLPHLLFAGPPGTGKSSLALIIVKKLFGENWRGNYLELNASDERGIDVIRQKVKDFARTRALSGNYKIIFLDESDALTREAQQALRRTMENFTSTCRFILSCNYSSKILEPIQSRCAVFRFKLLDKKDILEIISFIAKKEKLKIKKEAEELLYKITGGDCRKIINLLQAAASENSNITEELLEKIIYTIKSADVKKMLESAINKDFSAARELLLNIILNQSATALEIIKEINRETWNLSLPAEKKIKIIEKAAETEFRIVEGSDEIIQLEAFLASLAVL